IWRGLSTHRNVLPLLRSCAAKPTPAHKPHSLLSIYLHWPISPLGRLIRSPCFGIDRFVLTGGTTYVAGNYRRSVRPCSSHIFVAPLVASRPTKIGGMRFILRRLRQCQ